MSSKETDINVCLIESELSECAYRLSQSFECRGCSLQENGFGGIAQVEPRGGHEEQVTHGKITKRSVTHVVSYAAVFSVVTQRSSPRGEERCVTTLKTAA